MGGTAPSCPENKNWRQGFTDGLLAKHSSADQPTTGAVCAVFDRPSTPVVRSGWTRQPPVKSARSRRDCFPTERPRHGRPSGAGNGGPFWSHERHSGMAQRARPETHEHRHLPSIDGPVFVGSGLAGQNPRPGMTSALVFLHRFTSVGRGHEVCKAMGGVVRWRRLWQGGDSQPTAARGTHPSTTPASSAKPVPASISPATSVACVSAEITGAGRECGRPAAST
jgi:hypothetical protein